MYRCNKHISALDPHPKSEPHIVRVRTSIVDPIVWKDCCRVFERLEHIQDVIQASIEQSVQHLLEDTTGNDMITALQEELIYAIQEQNKHPKGSYYYHLIAQDIRKKEEELQRCEEEFSKSHDGAKLSESFQESVMHFLDFLNTMKGRYHEASFQEKRNALDVLGVRAYVSRDTTIRPQWPTIQTRKAWLSVSEAPTLTGIHPSSLRASMKAGKLKTGQKAIAHTVIHRDEIRRFIKTERQRSRLAKHDDEWFTVSKLTTTVGISNHHDIHEAIEQGRLKAETKEVTQASIHRDELNQFLQESPIRQREVMEHITPEIKIAYTPIFTGVQAPKDAQKIVNVVHNAGLAQLVVRLKPVIVVKG
ncbi:hypothetical protein KSF_007830 [Reticulibacter mediterranei]|uniref:Uncharacterized protein n=1 Tax=Reticulibacter mediterranei TaxID=2778369 RepID=A0A8J3IHB0_9CHLR|nr:helix-turn-helix domain-containing protein [Reticulibacter mediterranei]GHO90735.1 hypothetical protein KSF_007830 [Reticulibacter mediterranei]